MKENFRKGSIVKVNQRWEELNYYLCLGFNHEGYEKGKKVTTANLVNVMIGDHRTVLRSSIYVPIKSEVKAVRKYFSGEIHCMQAGNYAPRTLLLDFPVEKAGIADHPLEIRLVQVGFYYTDPTCKSFENVMSEEKNNLDKKAESLARRLTFFRGHQQYTTPILDDLNWQFTKSPRYRNDSRRYKTKLECVYSTNTGKK